MKIDWDIDLSEEDGDGDNCLGLIFIGDGKGNLLSEDLTYIDSWLFELGDSVIRLQRDMSDIIIDLLIELQKLIVRPLSEGLEMSYKNQCVYIKTFTEYKSCIEDAIRRFINHCRGSGETSSLIIEELEGVLEQLKGRV